MPLLSLLWLALVGTYDPSRIVNRVDHTALVSVSQGQHMVVCMQYSCSMACTTQWGGDGASTEWSGATRPESAYAAGVRHVSVESVLSARYVA